MSYRKRIKFFLVHTLRVSNKEADELIQSGKLKVNGNVVQENIFFEETDEILLGEKTLQKGFEYLYIRQYVKNTGVYFEFDSNFVVIFAIE